MWKIDFTEFYRSSTPITDASIANIVSSTVTPKPRVNSATLEKKTPVTLVTQKIETTVTTSCMNFTFVFIFFSTAYKVSMTSTLITPQTTTIPMKPNIKEDRF